MNCFMERKGYIPIILSMHAIAIIGAQWGDEGKGKIVSLFSQNVDIVGRFQGGPNAGHTVHINNEIHLFRIIPSGFLHAKDAIIGNGVVINLEIFLEEMHYLSSIKKHATKHIWISDRAHVILPKHIAQDKHRISKKIGTTKMGVGPAYTSKVARSGIRIADIISKNIQLDTFSKKFQSVVAVFRKTYTKQCIDSSLFLSQQPKTRTLLLEGAQGTFLDIDYGHYPYVTSSNTTAAAACTGIGISPKDLKKIYLVSCSYQTKVGGGPFPTKIEDPITVKHIQKNGEEIDGVTNLLRDCGWLDLVMLRQAVRLNAPDKIILTKLDVLSGLDNIKICTKYLLKGKVITVVPSTIYSLEKTKPVYKAIPGWSEDIQHVRKKSDLPKNLLRYVFYIQKVLQIPIYGISVGPEESQFVYL